MSRSSSVSSKEEEKPKEKSGWQKGLDYASTAPTAASLIPGLDTFTNILQIPVDLLRGDFVGAGLDLAGVLPGVGKKWESYGGKADIIITHCAPSSIQEFIAPEYAPDLLTEFLDELKNQGLYKKWFFGHYHIDKEIDDRHIAIFNKIIKVE